MLYKKNKRIYPSYQDQIICDDLNALPEIKKNDEQDYMYLQSLLQKVAPVVVPGVNYSYDPDIPQLYRQHIIN